MTEKSNEDLNQIRQKEAIKIKNTAVTLSPCQVYSNQYLFLNDSNQEYFQAQNQAQLFDLNQNDFQDFLQRVIQKDDQKHEILSLSSRKIVNGKIFQKINYKNMAIQSRNLQQSGKLEAKIQRPEDEPLIHKSNPNKKNNISKFLLRMFFQNIEEQQDIYKKDLDIFENVKQKGQIIYQRMIQKKYVGLNLLKNFFGSQATLRQSLLNRMAMMKILKRLLKKEIIRNSQLKKKMHYLQAVKVYLLRLFNSKLSERVQCQ